MTWFWRLVLVLSVLLLGPGWMVASGGIDPESNWLRGSTAPAGPAPDPRTTTEAIVQVYGARALAWKGAFGIHTWFAIKPTGAAAYTVHEVMGWRARSGRPALVSHRRAPDGYWFGYRPTVLAELRGPAAAAAIPRIDAAVAAYGYKHVYRAWPGPNSNTFTAYVAREVPDLRLDLPPTAVGKDYLGGVWATAPSDTGWQASFYGLLGLLLARDEGVELNLLGLSVGVDVADPALRLPGVGRVDL